MGRVADQWFSSWANRASLSRDGKGYIIGEKPRGRSQAPARALSWPGRYHEVAENRQLKYVVLRDVRFEICHSRQQVERDAAVRERLLKRLAEELDDSHQLSAGEPAELLDQLQPRPWLGCLLQMTPGRLLGVDRASVAREARLDGK